MVFKRINRYSICSMKRVSRKEKRRQRVLEYISNPQDIKYQGPLSYRYLRIIAWIAFAVAQILALATISKTMFGWNTIGEGGEIVTGLIGDLSAPLFVIASFGLILSGKKTHKEFLILYGSAFVAFGLAISMLYLRYVNTFLTKFGADVALDHATSVLSSKVGVNVFADLFMLSLFCYFVDYNPKKHFQGKKIYIFRLLSLIPVLYIVISYALKTTAHFGGIDLSFYFYPFLATKSPLVFLVFIVLALWIKNRERLFLSVGATKAQYKAYLKTNKNSLAFSIHLSVTITVFVVSEVVLFILLGIILISCNVVPLELAATYLSELGIGQTFPLSAAIPFILLYSYTRGHKNTVIDIFIPVIGIGLTAIVYIEWIFQFLIRFA